MTSKTIFIRRSEYRDSLFLMRLSNEISKWTGVKQAVLMMGTQNNKILLQDVGLLNEEADKATANDLIIALELDKEMAESDIASRVNDLL